MTVLQVCVGYLSLYFDECNFTDRVMVTLTTLLVVATLTSSIQAVKKLLSQNETVLLEFAQDKLLQAH